MATWEIKPQRDGYAVWKDGVFQVWCYSYEWAQHKQEELMKAAGEL